MIRTKVLMALVALITFQASALNCNSFEYADVVKDTEVLKDADYIYIGVVKENKDIREALSFYKDREYRLNTLEITEVLKGTPDKNKVGTFIPENGRSGSTYQLKLNESYFVLGKYGKQPFNAYCTNAIMNYENNKMLRQLIIEMNEKSN